ncbi:MAG: hypothetical protein ACD_58C00213G0002 [uncultured bacterium]|nr:MAG: hypothetical protein ACD_58C00213G0002 [uncultured bacterium]
MLDKKEHEVVLSKILYAIYSDRDLAPILGFKGGTACYLFYNLPRFSTDLDFNLSQLDRVDFVFKKLLGILVDIGEIKDKKIKANTIYFLLSYKNEAHNIKIEISTRLINENTFEIKNYLGLPILTMTKDCIFANKLVAVLDRKKLANRDLFDVYFFLKNNWPINENIIKLRTGKNTKEYLKEIIKLLEKKSNINILHSLGEVVDSKQKIWIKDQLIPELLFLLKLNSK